MKKTKRNPRAEQSKNDEIFAKKVISQLIISIFIFVVIFTNSKLPNSFSAKVNNYVRHYLVTSVDFERVVSTAKVYFDSFMNTKQSVPVNSADDTVSVEDN